MVPKASGSASTDVESSSPSRRAKFNEHAEVLVLDSDDEENDGDGVGDNTQYDPTWFEAAREVHEIDRPEGATFADRRRWRRWNRDRKSQMAWKWAKLPGREPLHKFRERWLNEAEGGFLANSHALFPDGRTFNEKEGAEADYNAVGKWRTIPDDNELYERVSDWYFLIHNRQTTVGDRDIQSYTSPQIKLPTAGGGLIDLTGSEEDWGIDLRLNPLRQLPTPVNSPQVPSASLSENQRGKQRAVESPSPVPSPPAIIIGDDGPNASDYQDDGYLPDDFFDDDHPSPTPSVHSANSRSTSALSVPPAKRKRRTPSNPLIDRPHLRKAPSANFEYAPHLKFSEKPSKSRTKGDSSASDTASSSENARKDAEVLAQRPHSESKLLKGFQCEEVRVNDSTRKPFFTISEFEVRYGDGDERGSFASFLDLDYPRAVTLFGKARLYESEYEDEDELEDDFNRSRTPEERSNGLIKVIITRSDKPSLYPQPNGTFVLETRLARYRFQDPTWKYAQDSISFEWAKKAMRLFQFGIGTADGTRVYGKDSGSDGSGTSHFHSAKEMVKKFRQRWDGGVAEEGDHSETSKWLRAPEKDGEEEEPDMEELIQELEAENALNMSPLVNYLYEHLPSPVPVSPLVFECNKRARLPGSVEFALRATPTLSKDEAEEREQLAEERERSAKALWDAAEKLVRDKGLECDEEKEAIARPSGVVSREVRSYIDGEWVNIVVYKRAKIRNVTYCAGDCVVLFGNRARALKGPKSTKGKKNTISQEQDYHNNYLWEEETNDLLDFGKDDEDITQANQYIPWWARIVYFYTKQDSNDVYAHVDWFHHGRHLSPLGERASYRTLYYADQCDDGVPPSAILGKVQVTKLPTGSCLPPRDGFYYWAVADLRAATFSDVEDLDDGLIRNAEKFEIFKGLACHCCDRRVSEFLNPFPVWNEAPQKNRSFTLHDLNYHENDYVYVTRGALTVGDFAPYRLARLLKIQVYERSEAMELAESKVPTALVQWLFRYDLIAGDKAGRKDERRLVLSSLTSTVPVTLLEGTFFLEHRSTVLEKYGGGGKTVYGELDYSDDIALEAYSQTGVDAFWVSDEFVGSAASVVSPPGVSGMSHGIEEEKNSHFSNIREIKSVEKVLQCSRCAKERLVKERISSRLLANIPASSSLEVYAGINGLGMGLHEAPFLSKTKLWAIDSNEFVSHVHNENGLADNCLIRTVSSVLGDVCRGKWANLPKKGEVQFIAGGFPCQAFSHANTFKRVGDPRCEEPFVFMSMLETYRPCYALCENVRGIVDFPLPCDASKSRKGGLVGMMLEIAVQLGYQVRVVMANAAAYGIPQNRRRFFMIFALRGLPLPEAPRASHSSDQRLLDFHLKDISTQTDKALNKGFVYGRRTPGAAPFPLVDFLSATSDLPPFEIGIHPIPAQRKAFNPVRWKVDTPTASPLSAYQTLPLTSFQRRLRLRTTYDPATSTSIITPVPMFYGHLIPSCHETTAKRLVSIKTKETGGSGNYRDIPDGLRPIVPDWIDQKLGQRPTRRNNPHPRSDDFWARIDRYGVASTLRTISNVDGASHGPRIHYEQNRPISLLEEARLQGFPSHFNHLGGWRVNEDNRTDLRLVRKALGNAVPVPVGRAFGLEFQKAFEKAYSTPEDWETKFKDRSERARRDTETMLKGMFDDEMDIDPEEEEADVDPEEEGRDIEPNEIIEVSDDEPSTGEDRDHEQMVVERAVSTVRKKIETIVIDSDSDDD